MRDRLLVGIAVSLAVSVVVTGGLALALTLERRGAGVETGAEGGRPPIAYVSDQEGEPAVYVMEGDGSNPHRVSEEGWRAFFPSWSPDGTRLAYITWRSEDEDAVVVVAAADSTERVRVSEGITSVAGLPAAWSPDGTRLAFVSQASPPEGSTLTTTVHIARADGGGVEESLEIGGFVVDEMKWSPAGDELLLVAAPIGKESGVYRLPVEGGEMREVWGRASAAAWSPDGEAVAVAVATGSACVLFIVRGEGEMEEVAQMTGNPEEVVWSPDGQHIALAASFQVVREYGQALFILDLESGQMDAVEPGSYMEGDYWLVWPNWSPEGVGAASRSSLLLFTMGPMRRRPNSDLPYADLWVYDPASGQLEQLTFEEGFEGLGVWGR